MGLSYSFCVVLCAGGTLVAGCNHAPDQLGDSVWLQSLDSATVPAPAVLNPCCAIVAIDARASIVTARETASGYTFGVVVNDRALLTTLRIADTVWADFGTKTARLRTGDSEPCCSIIAAPHR